MFPRKLRYISAMWCQLTRLLVLLVLQLLCLNDWKYFDICNEDSSLGGNSDKHAHAHFLLFTLISKMQLTNLASKKCSCFECGHKHSKLAPWMRLRSIRNYIGSDINFNIKTKEYEVLRTSLVFTFRQYRATSTWTRFSTTIFMKNKAACSVILRLSQGQYMMYRSNLF